MPITRFYIAIHVTKYLAIPYLCKARILNGQFVSHAIMFVASRVGPRVGVFLLVRAPIFIKSSARFLHNFLHIVDCVTIEMIMILSIIHRIVVN
jgi:hypothetical protein